MGIELSKIKANRALKWRCVIFSCVIFSFLECHRTPVEQEGVDDAPLLPHVVIVRVGHRDGEVIVVGVVVVVIAGNFDSSLISSGFQSH